MEFDNFEYPSDGNTYLPYPYPVNTCQLTIGNNTTTVLDTSNVKDDITNYTCTSIRNDAFFGCTALSNATMPYVQSIGDRAFFGCTALSNATMPHVQSIGESSFADCTALSDVVMSHVQSIGGAAFTGCTALSNAVMTHVKSIGGGAFAGCASLSNAVMTHVKSIGGGAFAVCTALSNAVMPQVQSIRDNAFLGCSSLSNAKMAHVQSIGFNAFFGCSSLSNATMPHVQSIGDNAFDGCTNLTSVVIPESTTFIGFRAFANTGITTLYFFASPDITVGDNAFYNLESNDDIITKITISITYIYIKNICDKYKYAKLLSLPVELFYQYEENYNYCFLSRALLPVSCASMMVAYLVSKYMKKNRNTKDCSNLLVCVDN